MINVHVFKAAQARRAYFFYLKLTSLFYAMIIFYSYVLVHPVLILIMFLFYSFHCYTDCILPSTYRIQVALHPPLPRKDMQVVEVQRRNHRSRDRWLTERRLPVQRAGDCMGLTPQAALHCTMHG